MYFTRLSNFSLHQWKHKYINQNHYSIYSAFTNRLYRGPVCCAQYFYIYCQLSNCSPAGEYQRQVGRTRWVILKLKNNFSPFIFLTIFNMLPKLASVHWLYAVGMRRHAKNFTVMAVTKCHLVQAVFHPRRTYSSNKLTIIVLSTPVTSCKYCSPPLYIHI